MSKKTKNLVTLATSVAMATNIITGGVPITANASTLQVSSDDNVSSVGSAYVSHSDTYNSVMKLITEEERDPDSYPTRRYISANNIDCNAKTLGKINGVTYISIQSFNTVPDAIPSEIVCLSKDGTRSGTYKIANVTAKACNQVIEKTSSHELLIPDGVCSVTTGDTEISSLTTKVTFPSSMENIPENFLKGKSNIKKVVFKGNTCSIQDGAFSETGIESVTIPSGFTMGEGVFKGCASLSYVSLPSNMSTLPSSTFENCTKLESITLPQNMTVLGDYAFKNSGIVTVANTSSSTSVSSGVIDLAGISTLGAGVFTGCKGISSVVFSNSLSSIGDQAFYNSSVKTVSIPESASVTNIGASAFAYSAVTSFDVPDSITGLNSNCFAGCSELTTVTFPDNFTTLRESVFNGCSKLSKLDFPASLKYVSEDAFNNAGTVSAISGDNPGINLTLRSFPTYQDVTGTTKYTPFKGLKSVKYVNPDGKVQTEVPSGVFANNVSLKSVDLCEGFVTLGDKAFYGCTGLEGIQIPSTVKTIGDSCFYGDTSLTSIAQTPAKKADGTEYYNLTTIGDYGFYGCTSLENFVVTDGVTSIGAGAFGDCGLKTLNVPSSVVSIGDEAFRNNLNLEEVTLNTGLQSIGSRAFQNDIKLSLLVKDSGVVLDGVYIPSTVTSVGEFAFDGASLPIYFSNNTEFTIVPKLDANGQEVDYGTDEKKNINVLKYFGTDATTDFATLSNYFVIDSLADGTFKGNTQLVKAQLPSTAKTIGKNLFEGCTALQGVDIPATVKEIPENCFAGCTSLTHVSFNTDTKSLEDIKAEDEDEYNKYAQFNEKGDLIYTSITIGTRVIDSGAFAGCTKLESITFPSTLEEIKSGAFDSCSILHNLSFGTLPSNIQRPAPAEGEKDNRLYLQIDENAFSNCNIIGYWTSAVNSNSVRYPVTIPDDVVLKDNAFTSDTILQNKGFQYQVTDEGVDIVKCYGYNYTSVEGSPNATQSEMLKTIEVPSQLNGRNVCYIGKDAFNNGTANSVTESIKLDNGIKGIKGHAFYNCGKLQSIQLCDSLESIEDYAFGGTNLKTVEIPTKVTGVSCRAFKDSAIQTVKSGNYIYKLLFTGSVNDEFQGIEITSHSGGQDASVTVPSKLNGFKVSGIGKEAFKDDSVLTTLSLSEGIQYLSEGAVTNCPNFSTFNNASTCSVDSNAFKGTAIQTHYDNGIEYKVVGNSVVITKYTGDATILNIPKEYDGLPVTAIADGAFSSCTNLVSVTMSEGITTIGNNAFSGCSLLSNVTIPYTVTSIGTGVFSSCTQLQTIKLPSLSSISDSLFKGCTNLQTIELPNVSSIGINAFNGCTKLSGVVIPESVKVIGKGAFVGTGVGTISIPHEQGVVTLDGAFTEGTVINYKSAVQQYTVIFKDYDGRVLSSQVVNAGDSAVEPASKPTREGYEFSGWDKSFSNITANLEVTATYKEVAVAGKSVTVTFKNWDGKVLKTEVVDIGSTATPPENPTRDGYTFAGWGKDLTNVSTDMEVVAQFNPNTGDATSALPLLGSMLMAITGAFGFKRKRK